jgi:hypothetical protein
MAKWFALAMLGLVLAGLGFLMPAETTESETVCANGGEYCHPDEDVTVERETDNDWKVPLMVGGGVLFLVGLFGGDVSD